MNTQWRRFAPWGLYLALFAALACGGLYLVFRQFNLYVQISLGLAVIGLAAFALLDPDKARQALTGRQAKYGSNALVLTLAVLGILIVVNYLVYKNSKRWDLTEDKQFTLSSETLQTLKSLPAPVTARAFYTPRYNSEQAKSLLDQYKFYGEGNFDYQFINPEENPVLAEQSGVSRDGTIVIVMGEQKEAVTIATEQELTGAMVRLINPEERTVYFLIGHGEYDPEKTGDQSYSRVKRALEGKNYQVKSLNILAENKIPDDARLIVIGGPRKPISQNEVDLIDNYIASGGALIVMSEPTPVTEFGDLADPLAEYLSDTWSITLGDDIVVDLTSQQVFAPFAARYGDHPITQKMQYTSVFPSVRSAVANLSTPGVNVVELVQTAEQSWAETDLTGIAEQPPRLAFDEGADLAGPVPLAVAAENTATQGRLVVFGDSDFVSDANFAVYGNSDLFINSVDWAVGQENLISLTPKSNTQRLLTPPQSTMMNLLMLGSVIVLPGLALVGSVVVFIQRRRRG